MWIAGCMVAGAIILLWNLAENAEKIEVFNNIDEIVKTNHATDNIVNELLLSADELNIYGKSSLIGYIDKNNRQATAILFEQIKTDPDKAYQAILKNKLDRLKQQQVSNSDFNVKPVPK